MIIKKYINELKNYGTKNTVFVETPFSCKNEALETLFPDKKIVRRIDPSLMVGVKIIENDMLYELNLKNTLEKLISQIENSYD